MRVTAIQETSVLSYTQCKEEGRVGRQQTQILGLLADRKCRSIGEIAAALGLEKSSVSARVNELLSTDHLVPCKKRMDNITGRLVRPVKLAPLQLGLPEYQIETPPRNQLEPRVDEVEHHG